MSFRDILARLMASTETAVVALHARLDAGELTEAEFVALAAAVVNRADAKASVVADLSVAAAVMTQTRRPVAPAAVGFVDQQPRLRESIRTLLRTEVEWPDSADDLAASRRVRLGRLARAEPASAAQGAAQQAMEQQPAVRGWRRRLNATPCALCRGWADGKVRPTRIRMNRHTGCSCIQEPVVSQ